MRSRIISCLLVLIACALTTTAVAAEAKATKAKKVAQPARHDPPDIPFRRAPMSNAVRTVHIPLATNLHLAFDTELLRTHTVWQGDTLNLWGAVYHAAKDKFYCDFNGQVLWTMPPVFPWAAGSQDPKQFAFQAPPGARFRELSSSANGVALRYDVPAGKSGVVAVTETAAPASVNGAPAVARHFRVGAGAETLWLLLHAESDAPVFSDGGARRKDVVELKTRDASLRVALHAGAGVELLVSQPELNFKKSIWSELKNDSERKKTQVRGRFTLVYARIPPRVADVTVEIISSRGTASGVGRKTVETTVVQQRSGGAVKTFPGDKGFLLPGGDESYRVEHFPVPKEIELLVTGMDFLPNGDLAVCTWLGDVYIVEKPTGAPAAAKYRRFARGLCEPGGLKVIEGDIYLTQKQELTRLRDTDGNGEADLFECISQDWGFTGNYHDFTFGPTLDRDGNFHIFRNGNRGLYDVPFMGWDIVVSRDGRTVTPFCAGLRSPNGFGSYAGEIWMTENQGNWMGACKLNNFRAGRFYGYPSTSPAPKDKWFDAPTEFSPPAVWFPYTLSKSASGIEVITDDRFGPFRGQMLVGEFQNATVTRVFLEQVNGEWQGCVWPFAKGFYSGVNRLSFGPDGKLYVGGCKNAAWAAVAPKDTSLDRVSFTGKVPFEIKEVRAHRDGFELTFTQPVDPATAGKTDNWDVSQYRYEYHQTYGSPEFDFDGKPNSASEVKVVSATVSADGLKVKLKLDGWRAGYVAAIRSIDVTNADGKPLRHETCWYTLNQIPK
jgi:hypothetical protein